MKALHCLLVAVTAIPSAVHASAAFVTPSQSKAKVASSLQRLKIPTTTIPTSGRRYLTPSQTTTTSIRMGYNLPPSGPKGPKEQFDSIISTIAPIALVALFFASPLGGIFFAVTNSLFVLALITPFVLFAGFRIWTALYTLEEPCPSCEAFPVRALKNGEPSCCLNCGAFVRVNEKGDGLELCNNPYDSVLNEEMGGGGSLFDAMFSAGGDGVSDFDVFGGGAKKDDGDQAKKVKRQGTIIDVEVERD